MKRDGLIPEHRLVLVGRKSHKYDDVIRQIDSDYQNTISVLEYVPDEHLPALYSGADVFVFPSRYEGFGMPILEARACGAPIVTTDIPELREAGSSDAIYVLPDVDGLRRGIIEALNRDTKPLPNSDLPTWRERAEVLASVLCPTSQPEESNDQKT